MILIEQGTETKGSTLVPSNLTLDFVRLKRANHTKISDGNVAILEKLTTNTFANILALFGEE